MKIEKWIVLVLCLTLSFTSFAYHHHYYRHHHYHHHRDYARHEHSHVDYFANFLSSVKKQAKAEGVSDKTIQATLGDTQKLKNAVLHPEHLTPTILTFDEYSGLNVNTRRVLLGQDKLRHNFSLLQKIAKQYQVPPEIIVALWGLETNYGGIQGAHQEIPTLIHLAYRGRRHRMFHQELLSALKMVDDKDIKQSAMHASWAGAMGQCQFMPSTYLKFAVDFDHDGKKDIWHDKADIFASTANYIHQLGWNDSHPLVVPVSVPYNFYPSWRSRHIHHSVKAWIDLGVKAKPGYHIQPSNEKASIYYPMARRSPAYLVYQDNYNVIYGWNHSAFYALSIGILANQIAKDLPKTKIPSENKSVIPHLSLNKLSQFFTQASFNNTLYNPKQHIFYV